MSASLVLDNTIDTISEGLNNFLGKIKYLKYSFSCLMKNFKTCPLRDESSNDSLALKHTLK